MPQTRLPRTPISRRIATGAGRRPLLAGGLVCAAALLMMAAPGSARAHHGWSAYDADKVLKLDTPLAEVRYRNPHGEVSIDHEGRRWNVVLAPISRMSARGLADNALQVGKTITIEGYPRRDGTPEIRAERITVDGKTIELR